MKTDTIFIIHPETTEQEQGIKAFAKALKIKFEIAKAETYNPDFIEKIERSKQDYKNGKSTKMTLDQLNGLWK